MNRHDDNQKTHQGLKRKLTVALVMLLISSLLMGTTSYAWFVLSTAPEVTGITTNVGANGSLEIALLNAETRKNLSAIKTSFNNSLQSRENGASANENWGNMVDLSFTDYGLSNIVLMPARLNVSENEGKFVVNSGMLAVPNYGFDGRIIELIKKTVSGTFDSLGEEFIYSANEQDFGVRAIGTSNQLSVQESALNMAKSDIATYTGQANSKASSTLVSYGAALFDLMIKHFMGSADTFNNDDLAVVNGMVKGLDSTVNYIDLALRQGIIAIGASELGDETQFNAFVDKVNGADDLAALRTSLGADASRIPEEFDAWIDGVGEMENAVNQAKDACAALQDGSYTWEEISGALRPLIDTDKIMINGTYFPQFDKNSASSLVGSDVEVRLAPGSGVFAGVADFTDNYSANVTYVGTSITMNTSTLEKPTHLLALQVAVAELSAAAGTGDAATEYELTTTYGYALDFAFRSNAAVSDLLLQTTPEQRIYDGSNAPSTMGGGSYMEFSTEAADFTLNQMLKLMDSVRVAFVDDTNTVLAVAKLNTVNRTTKDGVVKAPLYLYNFGFDENDGSIQMGERLKNQNTIVPLQQNVAKAITAIVWLDGDIVDNTMVSATASASLNGTLNLQFASSANLMPAANGELLSITTSKTKLDDLLADYKDEFEAGQGLYTTESWKPFAEAYTYAQTISGDAAASQTLVYIAAQNLVLSNPNTLVETNMDALNAKIDEIRALMGTSTEKGAYVVVNNNGTAEDTTDDYYEALTEYTTEQIAGNKGELKGVDGQKNLIDAGNGAKTVVYSAESWTNLAKALFNAEAVKMMSNPKYPEVNAALEALVDAQGALEREIYFTAYDLNGTLYYKATSLAEDNDAYGKWYDGQFNLVTADILILDLNAGAEVAEIAVLEGSGFITKDVQSFNPTIKLQNTIYPELANDSILGVHWNTPSMFTLGASNVDKAALNSLVREAISLGISSANLDAAMALLASGSADAAAIESAKTALQAEVDAQNQTQSGENSGTIEIPVGTGHSQVVYQMYYPSISYVPNGQTGTDTLSAWILTENGVIYELKEQVGVYERASDAVVNPASAAINVDGTAKLKVSLSGGSEDIESVAWSSADTAKVTVADKNKEECTVTGVAAGEVTLSVVVTTVQGNTYDAEVTVTVNAAAGD